MKKMDNQAQGSNFLLFIMVLFIMMFIFSNPSISNAITLGAHSFFYPLIGFNGKYPVLTIFIAGLIVVFLSSLLTNFFTDWKKMGESQEIAKAFQQELAKARKEGNTNRVKKLMKMQPEIMKKQTEASSGTMKPMIFLIIFIWPIFMWLRYFLQFYVPHYYFTVPWADGIPLISNEKFIMQAWLWLYLIFSMVIGQIIRQGLKYISWSDWWKNIKSKIKTTPMR